MPDTRKVSHVLQGQPTVEGAGVHLSRVFGFGEVPRFDPFLLLDDFRSDVPEQYLKGFPWHPHRGIETITYVLDGDVEHGDSLGNKGIIGSGDVQWMTAGSGIIHQEMPKGNASGKMYGFQLWANLPAADKMMNPRYRDITSDQIPTVTLPGDITIKIISGDLAGTRGPVEDIVIEPGYLDISIPADTIFNHPTLRGHTVFAYIIAGQGCFDSQKAPAVENGTLVLFGDGEELTVSTGERSVRFLLISGKPIGEPVAWQGPIVMNTRAELEIAFAEYRQGTFIKYKG
jgi:redox-sensitive bicupin YhaK (pirin superfamily)